ncbi:MAG: acyl-CoA reductase [Verrucomicrobiota bacterium]
MQTREIATHLAEAARCFPLLGPVTEEGLMGLIRAELGHEEALERFLPHGGHHARALGPCMILHIISGNTPHAGLQSLIRGLLLGAYNWCKIPSGGLPEIAAFRERLPFELARRVTIATELPGDWLDQADAVVVFGRDETVESFRKRVRADQRFLPHAHRISFGVVFDDPEFASVADAAKSASLYNQQGCLSPHLFYVERKIARAYAERLAGAMADFERETPRGPVSLAEQSEIVALRKDFAFRASMHSEDGEAPALWESPDSTAWTVLFDPEPQFMASCLNRVIYVKPMPDDLPKAVIRVYKHLSTVGIFPATPENAARVDLTGVSRICPIGQMQFPPLTWHHDAQPVLAPLVHWVDFEGA